MKLQEILEEMGMLGMDRIRKNFMRLVKRAGLPSQDYEIVSKGATLVIQKNRKPYGRLPMSKALDASYITAILKKDMPTLQRFK